LSFVTGEHQRPLRLDGAQILKSGRSAATLRANGGQDQPKNRAVTKFFLSTNSANRCFQEAYLSFDPKLSNGR
jgi:hypothetical protein